MKCIVAVDKNWAIGKDNGLLVHLPGDLKFFKEKTIGKVLVMGRKTLESLPGGKPLPNRITVLMTRDPDYSTDFENDEKTKLFVVKSFDELMTTLLTLEYIEGIDVEEDVFAAGGETIYDMLVPYCNEFFVTRIDAEFPADRYFPNMDKMLEAGLVKHTWKSQRNYEKGIAYTFNTYTR